MLHPATIAKPKNSYCFDYMGFHITSEDGELFQCRSLFPVKLIEAESKDDAKKKIKTWRKNCSW